MEPFVLPLHQKSKKVTNGSRTRINGTTIHCTNHYTIVTVGEVGVEPTPADFQSAASTELASLPNEWT